MEWLFLLKVLLVFLAGGVVCLLLTVVTTIVVATFLCGDPVSETSRPRRSRWQLIRLQLRRAPQRLFTVFVLRQPLTEDRAWYAPRLEADATDAPMPEKPGTVVRPPRQGPAAAGPPAQRRDNMRRTPGDHPRFPPQSA